MCCGKYLGNRAVSPSRTEHDCLQARLEATRAMASSRLEGQWEVSYQDLLQHLTTSQPAGHSHSLHTTCQGYISLQESDDVMKMENKREYDDAGDRDLESGRVAARMKSTITGPSPMRNSVERRLQQVGCFLLLVISDLSECR